MSESSKKFLIGIAAWLSAGALVGWSYGYPERGLLVAALLALVWQIRQLLSFDASLHSGNFDVFRVGDGIWQQMFSRFSYEHERGTRYKAQHRKLLREFQASTDAMPDGAAIVDANNEIRFCNRAAKELAGLKRKKDRGQRIDNILRDPELTKMLNSGDYSTVVEIPSPVKDGSWLSCRVIPFGENQKLIMLRDVTDRIRMQRTRRDFVANASHELRSPLTVISGYLDSLADDESMPSDWAKPVAQMRGQAQRMNLVVSDLIELSRLEGSGTAVTDESIDVSGVLNAVYNSMQDSVAGRDVAIQVDAELKLLGSASEIHSLVSNLLSNAIRYTQPDGVIRLRWQAVKDGAELGVSDNGEGIASEHIPRLTERFFRVDRGRSRDDGGIGLGLAIVKHILNRHNADLQVQSELGTGSDFICLFPKSRLST